MSRRFKALIVEDNRSMARLLNILFEKENFETAIVSSGIEAQKLIANDTPDVVILDMKLPDMNGMKVLTNLRMWSSIPVVVLSSRNDEDSIVTALDAGADDYITKLSSTEFPERELIARVNSAIRRKAIDMSLSHKYSVGDLEINYELFRVSVGGRDVGLTQSEFKIVALLGKNAGHVLTYDYIIRHMWGTTLSGDNQILRVNMANIRRKIEKNPSSPRYIFTEVGVGYRMATEDTLPIDII